MSFNVKKTGGRMWHEARKQEKKIRGMLVDYRRRAERRKDYYDKIKSDPTQFLQLHGRPCKIHLDPVIAAAGDSPATMMPWQGNEDNLIDRFDVRAHLDYIPEHRDVVEVDIPLTSEDRHINYERYRIIVQNEFIGVSEEKFLHQIFVEEQFGSTTKNDSVKDKKKSASNAAIGYNYETDEAITEVPNPQEPESLEDKQDEEDSDIDLDICVNVSEIESSQAHEMNVVGQKYGLLGADYFSFLTQDFEEAESLRQARKQEEEKAMYSGRRSRRERRAFREKKMLGRVMSPPSYAARESPEYNPYRSSSKSRSRSGSPNDAGQITYITSFGGEEETQTSSVKKSTTSVVKKINYAQLRRTGSESPTFNDKPVIKKKRSRSRYTRSRSRSRLSYKKRSGRYRSYSRSRSSRYSRLRKYSRSRSRSRFKRYASRSRSRSRGRRRSRSYRRSKTRSRSRTRNRRSRSYTRSRSKSRSRTRSKSRSRSSISSYYRSYTRSRSRSRSRRKSRSRNRSRKYSRSRTRSKSRSRYRTKSKSDSRGKSRSKSRQRSRTKSRSRLRTPEKSRSKSQSKSGCSRSKSKSSYRSRTRTRSRSKSRGRSRSRSSRSRRSRSRRSSSKSRSRTRSSSKSRSRSNVDSGRSNSTENKPTVPRYYGRRGKSSSLEIELSDSEQNDSQVEQKPGVNVNLNKPIAGLSTSNSGVATKSSKATPRERLKKKMQALLNKQYKADKKAEQMRLEKMEQQRQDREDEIREMSLKLRKKQRERRHRYEGTQSTDSHSSRSRSRSRDRRSRKSSRRARSRSQKNRNNHDRSRSRSRSRRNRKEKDRHSSSRRRSLTESKSCNSPRSSRGLVDY